MSGTTEGGKKAAETRKEHERGSGSHSGSKMGSSSSSSQGRHGSSSSSKR